MFPGFGGGGFVSGEPGGGLGGGLQWPTPGPITQGGPIITDPVLSGAVQGARNAISGLSGAASGAASAFTGPLSFIAGLSLTRIAMFLLGLVLIIGGIYLLKPAAVMAPARAAGRAMELGAAA